MKKILWVAGIVMLVVSTVFAAGISKGDLASLRGTWEGNAYIDSTTSQLKLEILNDAEPIQGKVTISNINRSWAGNWGWTGEHYTAESDNGVVTNKGTIMFTGRSGQVFEITSMGKDKKGKLVLQGWFFGQRGKVDWKATKK